mgnify:CR=1 FL=1
MKKILSLLIFSFFCFNNGLAINLPKDVSSGNNFFKSMDSFGKFKDYGAKIVNKSDGYPVRSGDKSLRFEIRAGDCYKNKSGWDDCEKKRERHELHGRKLFKKGEWWYAWSIYFPKDFIEVAPVRVFMGQFHSKDKEYGDERNPPWMFFNSSMESITNKLSSSRSRHFKIRAGDLGRQLSLASTLIAAGIDLYHSSVLLNSGSTS